MRKLVIIISLAFGILLSSCGIYSFSGTSIQPDVKTYTVEPIVNKAMQVNPGLANQMTEDMIDKYKKLTNLNMVQENGDLIIYGEIMNYNIRPMAITADEVASQNRLTITVKITYTNQLHEEENFEKTFSSYADYDSTQSFDSVENALVDEILEKLIDDIFNATVANW